MKPAFPPFPNSSFVQTCGYLTHLRTFGPAHGGTPVLLLHGFLDSTATWELVAEGISRDRRVLLMDLLGHGYTERPRKQGYTIPEILSQIAALQNALKLENLHLGGNSLGGILSVLFAIRSPERVASVIVVDGGVGGKRSGVPYPVLHLLTSPPVMWWIRQFLRPVEKRLFSWLFREWILGSGEPSEDRLRAFMEPMRLPGAPRVVGRLLRGYVSYFSGQKDREVKEAFAALAKPTLLVWGEKDRLVPSRVAEVLNKGLPDSRLVKIPGCGHCPQLDSPEEFVRILREFLASLDAIAVSKEGR